LGKSLEGLLRQNSSEKLYDIYIEYKIKDSMHACNRYFKNITKYP
jgi:hypothetical protein